MSDWIQGKDETIREDSDAVIRRMGAEIERLRERCEGYKGQVLAGSMEIERLRSEIAQLRSQAGDNIECAEAEQRGFLRGLAFANEQNTSEDR